MAASFLNSNLKSGLGLEYPENFPFIVIPVPNLDTKSRILGTDKRINANYVLSCLIFISISFNFRLSLPSSPGILRSSGSWEDENATKLNSFQQKFA